MYVPCGNSLTMAQRRAVGFGRMTISLQAFLNGGYVLLPAPDAGTGCMN